MKKSQVKIGGTYRIKEKGEDIIVQVVSAEQRTTAMRSATYWRCKEASTGRPIFVLSAAKFRDVNMAPPETCYCGGTTADFVCQSCGDYVF